MSRAIAWAPRKSRARWSLIPRSRRRPWWAIRTTSRARASMPMSRLMTGDRADRRAAQELVLGCARRSGRSPPRTSSSSRPSLPKTRSGKIMRRILRKIAENEFGSLGDTSTLADPGRGRRPDRQPTEPRHCRRRMTPPGRWLRRPRLFFATNLLIFSAPLLGCSSSTDKQSSKAKQPRPRTAKAS